MAGDSHRGIHGSRGAPRTTGDMYDRLKTPIMDAFWEGDTKKEINQKYPEAAVRTLYGRIELWLPEYVGELLRKGQSKAIVRAKLKNRTNVRADTNLAKVVEDVLQRLDDFSSDTPESQAILTMSNGITSGISGAADTIGPHADAEWQGGVGANPSRPTDGSGLSPYPMFPPRSSSLPFGQTGAEAEQTVSYINNSGHTVLPSSCECRNANLQGIQKENILLHNKVQMLESQLSDRDKRISELLDPDQLRHKKRRLDHSQNSVSDWQQAMNNSSSTADLPIRTSKEIHDPSGTTSGPRDSGYHSRNASIQTKQDYDRPYALLDILQEDFQVSGMDESDFPAEAWTFPPDLSGN